MDSMIKIYKENQRLQQKELKEFNKFLKEKGITENQFNDIVFNIILSHYKEVLRY